MPSRAGSRMQQYEDKNPAVTEIVDQSVDGATNGGDANQDDMDDDVEGKANASKTRDVAGDARRRDDSDEEEDDREPTTTNGKRVKTRLFLYVMPVDKDIVNNTEKVYIPIIFDFESYVA